MAFREMVMLAQRIFKEVSVVYKGAGWTPALSGHGMSV